MPDALSFVWQFREIFVDEFYRFDTTSSTPVIFDCGTNIGTSVVYFRQTYPNARIVAFEADEQISAILQTNYSKTRFRVLRSLRKPSGPTTKASCLAAIRPIRPLFSRKPTKSWYPLSGCAMFCLRETRIDMLKMDIEGAETAVLTDCRDALAHVQNLFVEFHAYLDHPQTLAEVMNVLEESGFRYYINTSQYRHAPLVNHRTKATTAWIYN